MIQSFAGKRTLQVWERINRQWRICFRWTSAGRISAITHGRRRITADTGLRLSRYLGMSEAF